MDSWSGVMLLHRSFSLVLSPWWSVSGYASRKGMSMLTSTKSCIILIVTSTMSIISMVLEKDHGNPTVTHTNTLISSIVTVTLPTFTIDTSTSQKRRETHSRPDRPSMLAQSESILSGSPHVC